jgi:hypothetical protein
VSTQRSRLTTLQTRVLTVLADMRPPWTLSGGGALAAVHLGHRPTRDLDLFWHGLSEFKRELNEVRHRLTTAGLSVDPVEQAPGFIRLRIGDGSETVVLDMVAESVPFIEPPARTRIDGAEFLVDTPHEILVNKLCAILGRTELRDLIDLRALLEMGGDFERAMHDAPRKDGGFSPLTLVWLLDAYDVKSLGRSEGLSTDETTALDVFRRDLAHRIATLSRP